MIALSNPVPLVENPAGRRELWLISCDHHACAGHLCA